MSSEILQTFPYWAKQILHVVHLLDFLFCGCLEHRETVPKLSPVACLLLSVRLEDSIAETTARWTHALIWWLGRFSAFDRGCVICETRCCCCGGIWLRCRVVLPSWLYFDIVILVLIWVCLKVRGSLKGYVAFKAELWHLLWLWCVTTTSTYLMSCFLCHYYHCKNFSFSF